MSDYYKTTPKQIEHLKKLGLIIPDDEKASEILTDIGLYRLGFYLFPFEQNYPLKCGRDHIIKPNVFTEHCTSSLLL